MAESIKLKAILHLMKLRVLLYGWSYFSEMRPASLLNATVADGPHPPLVDRTRGVKVSCSTSRTRCSYALLFSRSCFVKSSWKADLYCQRVAHLRSSHCAQEALSKKVAVTADTRRH